MKNKFYYTTFTLVLGSYLAAYTAHAEDEDVTSQYRKDILKTYDSTKVKDMAMLEATIDKILAASSVQKLLHPTNETEEALKRKQQAEDKKYKPIGKYWE